MPASRRLHPAPTARAVARAGFTLRGTSSWLLHLATIATLTGCRGGTPAPAPESPAPGAPAAPARAPEAPPPTVAALTPPDTSGAVPLTARYADATRALEAFIAHEMRDKAIPAMSIALVDDQVVVWARGFGEADPATKVPASATTVHRVGSVSKLFTDIAVMHLVERGVLDLDAPITRWLPDFRPENPFGTPITLRQLMSHRAGLVREPPAGNYFDTTGTSLAATVRSLNGTRLVYAPGTRSKYSNAGIAVVGYVLETVQREPFATHVKEEVLRPMGLARSAFTPEPVVRARLAKATMWTLEGRTFPAPTFELGMAPAGSMYAPITDLAQFLRVLFADGMGPEGQVVRRATLEQMWTPQFAPDTATRGFGIGFAIARLDGRRMVRHGGAIYGFATELAALPDDRLGVAVAATKDGANAVTDRIATTALHLMRAVRTGAPLPRVDTTSAVPLALARRLDGRWANGARAIDVTVRDSSVWLFPLGGGARQRLMRLAGDTLVVDDEMAFGTRVRMMAGDRLLVGADTLARAARPEARDVPARWRGLIGEYGWDHNTLFVYERDGALRALIEWFFDYPLARVSDDVWAFPASGLYDGERLLFTRDATGRATKVEAASVVFPRRQIDGEEGGTFRIVPERPVEELRREALAASPPAEAGPFRPSELVELVSLDPTIRLDVRYASTNNFISAPMYSQARAFLQRPAAEALVRVHRALRERGYGLLVHDAYRPWYVTKMFWEATPEAQRVFVANPANGSRHNRGCAVDLTLFDLRTGRPVEMTGGYDEFSSRSYPEYPGGTSRQRWHRELLRAAMEAEGFRVYEAEWWHFDYRDWRVYPIGNVPFERIAPAG